MTQAISPGELLIETFPNYLRYLNRLGMSTKDLKKEYSEEIREKCDAVKFVGAEVWQRDVSYRYKDKKTKN